MLALHSDTDNEIMINRDAVTQKICDVVLAECNFAFGNRMKSLILTGSAARDESTIVQCGNGWKVLGDAEFVLVFRRAPKDANGARADAVKRNITERLYRQGVVVSSDFALVTDSYLKSLPHHIFSYELRACGKVVFGDPDVLQMIPQFAASDVSHEDAWRLLNNRMIEQLQFVGDLEDSPVLLTPRLHYATVKLYLDMATSYLVFAGAYEPTYQKRAERLTKLAAEKSKPCPFSLENFAARVAECTSWKLKGHVDCADRHVELWLDAISYMHHLWRWEVMRMIETTEDFSDKDLWSFLAKRLTPWQRLRGWASVMKRSGALNSWRNLPRWAKLSLTATPRYWIYRAGVEVCFSLPDRIDLSSDGRSGGLDCANVASILPMRKSQFALRSNAWKPLVREIAQNYWMYLADTRA